MPSFRSINLALSAGLHWRLPKQFTYPLALAYEQTIMELGASLDSGLMLDVGAGLSTVANKSLGLNGAIGIIGMDIAEDALHTMIAIMDRLAIDGEEDVVEVEAGRDRLDRAQQSRPSLVFLLRACRLFGGRRGDIRHQHAQAFVHRGPLVFGEA